MWWIVIADIAARQRALVAGDQIYEQIFINL